MLLLALACGEDTSAPSRRVDVVAAPKVVDPRRVAGFCEVSATAADARPFTPLPTTDPWPDADGWRWINVWATWCGPCVAEMPMLLQWRQKLPQVAMTFVSVDEDPSRMQIWLKRHPEFPLGTLRVAGPENLAPWLAAQGLDAGTAIPLHIFVDREDRVRCVRSGAIDPGDFDLVAALVGS